VLISDVWTAPWWMPVTRDTVETTAVEFAARLGVGESLTAAAAEVYLVDPPNPETLVAGVVTAAVVSGTKVNVSWTGANLTVGKRYRLEVKGTVTPGSPAPVRELLTELRCEA
jgi:hypothetical protein